jgi:hypothetical protein
MVKTKKYLKKNKRKSRRGGAIFGPMYNSFGKRLGFLSKPKKISANITDYFVSDPITPNDLRVPRYYINMMDKEGFRKLYLKDSIGETVTALKNRGDNSSEYIGHILLRNQDGKIFMSGIFKIGKNETYENIWEVKDIFPIALEHVRLNFNGTKTNNPENYLFAYTKSLNSGPTLDNRPITFDTGNYFLSTSTPRLFSSTKLDFKNFDRETQPYIIMAVNHVNLQTKLQEDNVDYELSITSKSNEEHKFDVTFKNGTLYLYYDYNDNGKVLVKRIKNKSN